MLSYDNLCSGMSIPPLDPRLPAQPAQPLVSSMHRRYSYTAPAVPDPLSIPSARQSSFLHPISDRRSALEQTSDRSPISAPTHVRRTSSGFDREKAETSNEGHDRVSNIGAGSSSLPRNKRRADTSEERAAKRKAYWSTVLISEEELPQTNLSGTTTPRNLLREYTTPGGSSATTPTTLGGEHATPSQMISPMLTQDLSALPRVSDVRKPTPSLFAGLSSGAREPFLAGLGRLGGTSAVEPLPRVPTLVGGGGQTSLFSEMGRTRGMVPPPLIGPDVVLYQGTRRSKPRDDRDRPWACERCSSRFSIKGHLSQHIRYVHLKWRPHRCHYPACSASFGTQFARNQHCWTVHERKKPFHCTVPGCESRFGQRSHLNRHAKRHIALDGRAPAAGGADSGGACKGGPGGCV